MRALLLLVLYVALHCASSDSDQENIETLMDQVLVLRVPHGPGTRFDVPLICGEAYENQPVFWKKNGKEPRPALQGNQVSVLVEEMDGGNYTCHLSPGGEYLNHTLILVQLDPDNMTVILEEKDPGAGQIHCSGFNYNGSFHCSWTRTASRSQAAVLLVRAERDSQEITCDLDTDGSGVQCQDISCSFNEEQHRISLTVYIHSDSRLEAYTKAFYLREIVRPEQLPNLHYSDGAFSWDYPNSWAKPCGFFGLEFQVMVVQHEVTCDIKDPDHIVMSDNTEKTNYVVNIKHKKFIFCVRAQDKHTKGPWSNWSHYNVKKHKTHH
ncbi:interleukin-12 subunit beta [Centroberyx affinis]|uniref:interleukin-12 subunit beta n=1 Tax=Centroberyx affinis TaxID=166261 RepID=UPI003A5C23A7